MKCLVPNCVNINSKAKHAPKNITFHKLPKDPKLREVWFQALDIPNWMLSDKSIVCSDHFSDKDFFLLKPSNTQKRLRSGAIPFKRDLFVPVSLRICKICLHTDVKMYDINKYKWNEMYEYVAGIPPRADPGGKLPQQICWECLARLKSAAEFRRKVLLSDDLLIDLLKTGAPLQMTEIIILRNEKHNKLKSPLSISKMCYELSQDRHQNLSEALVKTELKNIPNNAEIELEVKDLVADRITMKDEGNNEVFEEIPKFDDAIKTEVDFIPTDIIIPNQRENEGIIDVNLCDINDIVTQKVETKSNENVCTVSDVVPVKVNKESNVYYWEIDNAGSEKNCDEKNVGVPGKVNDQKTKTDNYEILDTNKEIIEIVDSDDDNNMDISIIEDIDIKQDEVNIFSSNVIFKDLSEIVNNLEKSKKPEIKEVIKNKKKAVKKEIVENQEKAFRGRIGTQPYQKPMLPIDENVFTIAQLSKEQLIQEVLDRKETKRYKQSLFKCTVCYIGFSTQDKLTRHEIKHSEQSGPIQCEICKIRVKLARHLRAHIKNSHMEEFCCKLCPLVTRHRAVALEHVKYHAGKKYNCPQCNMEYEKKTTLLNHLRLKHLSDNVCELCGYTFIGKTGIIFHKNQKHKLVDKNVELKGPYCKECNVKFLSKKAFDRHLRLSSKHIDEEDPNRMSNDSSIKSRRIGMQIMRSVRRFVIRRRDPNVAPVYKGPINCEQCGLQLQTRREYASHFKITHPGMKRTQIAEKVAPYMCEQCGKIFTNRTSLAGHMWVHTGEKRFQCDHCNKTFCLKSNLALHMEKQHLPTRTTYACPVCNKLFKFSSNLTRHMFLHTGLKPFQCDACEKKFPTSGELRSHVDHVHLKKPRPKRKPRKRVKKSDMDMNSLEY